MQHKSFSEKFIKHPGSQVKTKRNDMAVNFSDDTDREKHKDTKGKMGNDRFRKHRKMRMLFSGNTYLNQYNYSLVSGYFISY